MIFNNRQSNWLSNLMISYSASVAVVLLIFFSFVSDGSPVKEIEPTPFNTTLASVVGRLVPRLHYTARPFDRELSSRLFDEYFSSLDRNRRYFLASDIREFEHQKDRLHSLILAGDLSFPYQVFNRYLQRVRERVAYVREALNEPFDFDTDEVMLIDRSEEPWAEHFEELDAIWRLNVKNRLLIYKMMDFTDPEEMMENDGDEDREWHQDQTDNGDGNEEAYEQMTEPVIDYHTPEERVLAHYERMLKQLEDSESIDVLETFLNAFTRIYDPHSNYMPPAREEDFEIDMSLSLEGIGAVLSTDEGYIKVMEIIPGGPAEREGSLQVGDRIIGVSRDGEMVDVINMSLQRVVRMIRGPKGTEVHLQVLEAGRGLSAVPVTISLERDEVHLREQQAKGRIHHVPLPGREQFAEIEEFIQKYGQEKEIAEDEDLNEQINVLFISLPSFYADLNALREGDSNYRRASRDIEEILTRYREEEVVDGIILDLRYNSGGSLEEAIKVAGLFLSGGPVVQVRSTGDDIKIMYDEDQHSQYDGPLIVLVNKFSASASEIVAAAIQDYGRGIVVGDGGTYGKGTVQNIYDLNRFFSHHPFFIDQEAGSLKFTMAKYYRISGGSVQKKGVVPDISMPAFTDHMEMGEANLEDALPWKSIDSLVTEDEVQSRWRRHLPILEASSERRIEQDAEFQKINKLIERYQGIRDLEVRSLNLRQRRKLHEEEEEWFSTIRAEAMSRRRYEVREDKDETGKDSDENRGPDDPQKNEALRVMADLAWLDRRVK